MEMPTLMLPVPRALAAPSPPSQPRVTYLLIYLFI